VLAVRRERWFEAVSPHRASQSPETACAFVCLQMAASFWNELNSASSSHGQQAGERIAAIFLASGRAPGTRLPFSLPARPNRHIHVTAERDRDAQKHSKLNVLRLGAAGDIAVCRLPSPILDRFQ
jgi:hypothetical protein